MRDLQKAANLAREAYNETIAGAIKYENKRTSMVAFLERDQGNSEDWLVFRGTDSIKDWAYNFNFLPVRVQGSWIHCGFWLAHRSLWKKIRKDLNPAKKLKIVGHSLGGAMAEASVLMLKKQNFKHIDLYAFGKPNLFAKFQRDKQAQLDFPAFKKQVSVVNSSDVVARVPRIGYRAALNQTQLWFGPEGVNAIDPESSTKRKQWDMSESISDHGMDGYCMRMEAFLKRKKKVAALASKLRE
jgi:predicted lipase